MFDRLITAFAGINRQYDVWKSLGGETCVRCGEGVVSRGQRSQTIEAVVVTGRRAFDAERLRLGGDLRTSDNAALRIRYRALDGGGRGLRVRRMDQKTSETKHEQKR